MRTIKSIFMAFIASIFAFMPFAIVGCSEKRTASAELVNCSIEHEQEFGGVYIKNTIEEFNKLGFEYGDSVNIVFSNGYKLLDIPYYNGYYTQTGEPLLIAYHGYDYIKAAINNGDDLWNVADLGLLMAGEESGSVLGNSEKKLLWNTAGLEENMTATITISQKGKYLDIQQARDIHYLDDRNLYPSDEVFANFRSISGGNLKENLIYRSASPCDNQHNRAACVDALIEKAGVEYIINLADTDSKIQGYMSKDDFNSTYFETLYNKDDTDNDFVAPLALNMNFSSDYFKQQVVKAMMEIVEHDGPYLVHCTEGKDRTGFVCMLIEAFAGANYKEIREDYMMTYFNYYAITKAFDAKRYETIVKNVLDPMIGEIISEEGVEFEDSTSFATFAEQYLLENGMTEAQIASLRTKICR